MVIRRAVLTGRSWLSDKLCLQENLTDLLERCAKLFEQAERYELLGEIYRLIVPIYEQRRDFVKLSDAYLLLHKAYSAVVEAQTSGRRLLGNYFKVAFYGAVSARSLLD